MPSARGSRWRFVLGMLQMFGAVAGITLLIATGPGPATLAVVAVTTLISIASRILYRNRRRAPAATHDT